MKAKIHPNYGLVQYRCAGCKNEWVSASTKLDGKDIPTEGLVAKTITLEICSNCHPFYSGKKSFVDSAGRVEKFNKRFGQSSLSSRKATKKTAAPASETPAS